MKIVFNAKEIENICWIAIRDKLDLEPVDEDLGKLRITDEQTVVFEIDAEHTDF